MNEETSDINSSGESLDAAAINAAQQWIRDLLEFTQNAVPAVISLQLLGRYEAEDILMNVLEGRRDLDDLDADNLDPAVSARIYSLCFKLRHFWTQHRSGLPREQCLQLNVILGKLAAAGL